MSVEHGPRCSAGSYLIFKRQQLHLPTFLLHQRFSRRFAPCPQSGTLPTRPISCQPAPARSVPDSLVPFFSATLYIALALAELCFSNCVSHCAPPFEAFSHAICHVSM